MIVGVEREVGSQQHRIDEQPLGQQAEGPDEGYAAQEPEEERRVAQRCQQSAAVGHDEDREQDRVDPVATFGVRVEQRPDEQHGRAGRTHETG